MLIDGSPVDKIVKINPTTGAAVTWLDSTGRADAPDANTAGITYMDGYLYVVSNKNDGWETFAYVYKINPSNATVESTYNLNNTAMMWGEAGGISNNGTNLLVYKAYDNEVFFINPTDGSNQGSKWTCCSMSWGTDAVAYHAERKQMFVGKNDAVVAYPVSGVNAVSYTHLTLPTKA